MLRRGLPALLWMVIVCGTSGVAAGRSRIEGSIVRADGSPVGGVVVVLQETGAADVSNTDGRYRFDDVGAGTYTLLFTLGEHSASQSVTVTDVPAVSVKTTIDWMLAFSDSVTVTGASRHVERVVDAPSAVTVFAGDEIGRHAVDTQLPRLLTSAPGVELTQSSLYSFTLNVRGFNTLNGRRLPVFIDGRDPSTPVVLGNQEWGALPVPLDDVATVELVRGPSAALYGAGAFNGVVNITTKRPADAPGGQVRITVGELNTAGISARQAGRFGNRWSYRVSGAFQRSRDFTRSRVSTVEYAGLQNEIVPVPDTPITLESGSVRLDRAGGSVTATVEGGIAGARGVTAVTPVGRSFTTDTERPWARVNFSRPGWNLLGYYTGRFARDLKSLSAGSSVYLSESSLGTELQHHRLFARGRGQIVAGAAFRRQDVNSLDPRHQQTVFPSAESATQESLFGQLDWNATSRLKAVVSGRWENSTLHDARIAPRAAVVFAVSPTHTFRVNFSDAFQSPSLVEFFLHTPVAAPVDLAPLELALAPLLGGTPLNFSNVPVLALGNRQLRVERIRSVEAGYTGVLGTKLLTTAAYYHNELRDFTSTLLPQVGTALGRLNPDYAAYTPPAALSGPASAAVLASLRSALPPSLFDALSTDRDGRPVFALLSFGTYGSASADGIEAALTYWPRTTWRFDASYSLFTFGTDDRSGVRDLLSPNTPRQQLTLAGAYAARAGSASIKMRAVDGFQWSSGIFIGHVPSYTVIDVAAARPLDARWRLEMDVANLFDRRHYEAFGGALLGRRVLGGVVYGW